jgi:hypothetical protein
LFKTCFATRCNFGWHIQESKIALLKRRTFQFVQGSEHAGAQNPNTMLKQKDNPMNLPAKSLLLNSITLN